MNIDSICSYSTTGLFNLEYSKAERQQIRIFTLHILQHTNLFLLSVLKCIFPFLKLDFHILHLFQHLYLPKDGHNLSFI